MTYDTTYEKRYIEDEANGKASVYKIQTIGLVDVDDGQDHYLLIEDNEEGFPDHTSHQILWQFLQDRYYSDTETPGSWFCHQVSVLEHRKGNSALGIIHYRRNI